MMTPQGAQRVLDYRVFRHNFGGFPEHQKQVQSKYNEFKIICTEFPNKRIIGGQHRHFQADLKKIKQ